MIQGSDPEKYASLESLFANRDCAYEYADKRRTWSKLLAPWRL